MQEKQIIHIHRVGSVTFGLVLVVRKSLCALCGMVLFYMLSYAFSLSSVTR